MFTYSLSLSLSLSLTRSPAPTVTHSWFFFFCSQWFPDQLEHDILTSDVFLLVRLLPVTSVHDRVHALLSWSYPEVDRVLQFKPDQLRYAFKKVHMCSMPSLGSLRTGAFQPFPTWSDWRWPPLYCPRDFYATLFTFEYLNVRMWSSPCCSALVPSLLNVPRFLQPGFSAFSTISCFVAVVFNFFKFSF